MRALVTGGSGQLGRALAASAPQGWQVWSPPRAELDIADASRVAAAIAEFAPDIVINAAAYTAVDRAETERDLAFAANGEAVAHLAAACTARAARLVQISTDFVFDGGQSSPYRPADKTAPLGVYGASKLAGERAALDDPASLVVRTSWVYDRGGRNFVTTMLRLMAERDEVRVVADQIGTPTHAASLAAAVWRLAGGGAAGVFHFTDSGVASWYDFAVAIQEAALGAGVLGRRIPVVPVTTSDYPTPARRPAYSVLDKTDTWRRLGYVARHWQSELRDMIHPTGESADG